MLTAFKNMYKKYKKKNIIKDLCAKMYLGIRGDLRKKWIIEIAPLFKYLILYIAYYTC